MYRTFFWAFIERGGQVVIQFVSLVVLGRLLSPQDYGVYGIMMIFISIAELLIDSGFGGALIQKKELTQKDINTLFVTNTFIGIFMYAILFFLSPLVSVFYSMPNLTLYLRVLGIVVIIYSLTIVQTTLLQRELRLKESATVILIASMVSVIGALIFAVLGFGIWSLIIQQLLMSIVMVLLLWIKDSRNIHFEFSRKSFDLLWNFGSKILMANIILRIYDNMSTAIIPKIATITIAGYYVQASKIYSVSVNTVSTTIDKVTFPILCKEHNMEVLLLRSRNINRKIASFVIPLYLILSLFSTELIYISLGEKWLQSSLYLSIVSLGGIGLLIQTLFRNIFKSMADTSIILFIDTIKAIFGFIILVFSLKFGVLFMVCALTTLGYVGSILYGFFLSKRYGYFFWAQMEDFYKPLLSSVLVYVVFKYLLDFMDFHWCNVFFSVFFYIVYLIVNVLMKNLSIQIVLNKISVNVCRYIKLI